MRRRIALARFFLAKHHRSIGCILIGFGAAMLQGARTQVFAGMSISDADNTTVSGCTISAPAQPQPQPTGIAISECPDDDPHAAAAGW